MRFYVVRGNYAQDFTEITHHDGLYDVTCYCRVSPSRLRFIQLQESITLSCALYTYLCVCALCAWFVCFGVGLDQVSPHISFLRDVCNSFCVGSDASVYAMQLFVRCKCEGGWNCSWGSCICFF